ncbi:(2,3-dihydroxybenzoyl)adenylate synthase [Pseudobutyrivibrio sp.]|uniref:(2,3-dihydroxybenzoyl)adenylate synthase n=1 Tax=Pseudobutyrivibrio sp. TaxID=2014367 RepID=UPI001B40B2BE|nr:AMP-binding protein [Pseudobutyrivibrio sp.]MBP3262661.1 AMP-binding protein [Pseudobutyrivibrio sp.]
MNLSIKQELENRYEKEVWIDSTLGESLESLASKFQDKIAVTFDQVDYSYEDLNDKANRVANGLLKMEFKPGEHMVVQLPNSYEFVTIVFGMFKAGIIPIFALPAQRKNEIYGILQNSGATGYVIANSFMGFDYLSLADEVIEMGYKGKILVSGDSKTFLSTKDLYQESAEVLIENISPGSIALYLLSGGTTGVPKLIPRRHGDYLYMASQVAKRCELDENSVYLVSLPVEHNFPWGCPGVIGTLLAGGRVVISSVSSPDEILSLIEDEGVTITALVPVLANMCIDLLEYDDFDLSTLKVVQIGGSVLDPNLAIRIEEGFGCILQQVFGIAEGLICTTRLEDDDEVRFYKQGTPVSCYDEPRIVDEAGNDVSVGEFGHLITRGPYTIYSYLNGEKECVDEKCYFLTGDRARFCEDGNIQVVGRLMEMINRAGEKIDPTELEDMLISHPKIEDVQVVGIKDDNLGEKICVFIRDDEETLKLNEIRDFLITNKVAAFKLPDQIKYVSDWPLTNVGKINRKELKKMGEIV